MKENTAKNLQKKMKDNTGNNLQKKMKENTENNKQKNIKGYHLKKAHFLFTCGMFNLNYL